MKKSLTCIILIALIITATLVSGQAITNSHLREIQGVAALAPRIITVEIDPEPVPEAILAFEPSIFSAEETLLAEEALVEPEPEPVAPVERLVVAPPPEPQLAPSPDPEPTLAPAPQPESPDPAVRDFAYAMRHLVADDLYQVLSREERLAVYQILVDQVARENGLPESYTLQSRPDSEFPAGWGAFASRANRTLTIRDSTFDRSTDAYYRWLLVYIVQHEATHMVHLEYIFREVGNGAFLANTQLFGDDPTEALEEIRRNLTSGTGIRLTAYNRDEYRRQLSEYTADRTAFAFVERFMPAGIATINLEIMWLERIR